MSQITNQDKAMMENLSGGTLTNLEVFEAKQNLLGFFSLLLKIDKRLNPKNYEDNGDTNNPD